jgi:predicted esterase
MPTSNYPDSKLPCSIGQLLAISLPICLAILFASIFVPLYVKHKKENTKYFVVRVNGTSIEENETDVFEENILNITYATLTPKDGYDNIMIFLGGIGEVATKYFDFFNSNTTFIPKRTKIYSLSGNPRQMQFVIDYYNNSDPVPGWFNIDSRATLRPNPHNFTEANQSLYLVLDEIDRIKSEGNVDYKNIYLSGFSQGGMMTNYILLNSRHELGGYIAFSGYVFDHDLSANTVIYNLSPTQQSKIDSRKDYHILATHSFNDDRVFYKNSAESYQEYYKKYTDFKLLSFGELEHYFETQPIFPEVRKWLRKRMNK